jgi:hypothetical protein
MASRRPTYGKPAADSHTRPAGRQSFGGLGVDLTGGGRYSTSRPMASAGEPHPTATARHSVPNVHTGPKPAHDSPEGHAYRESLRSTPTRQSTHGHNNPLEATHAAKDHGTTRGGLMKPHIETVGHIPNSGGKWQPPTHPVGQAKGTTDHQQGRTSTILTHGRLNHPRDRK